jgi:hypothetical protein
MPQRRELNSARPTAAANRAKTQTTEKETKLPNCAIHPDVELVCPSCFAAKGGAATKGVTSPAKASAKNGRLGGRPDWKAD